MQPGRVADHPPRSNADVNDFSVCTGHLNSYILENICSYSQQQQQQQRRRRRRRDDDDDDENDTEKFDQLHATFLSLIGITLRS